MRTGAAKIWEAWDAGGPFVAEFASAGRVTVEQDYRLERAYIGDVSKQPVRWFQRSSGSFYDEGILTAADYDDSWWGAPFNTGDRSAGDAAFPDNDALWIWAIPGFGIDGTRVLTPTGSAYFRKEFTLVAGTSITISATADNIFDLYLDGEKVLTSGPNQDYTENRPAWTYTFSVTVVVSAGTHLIAAKARNTPQPDDIEEPGNPAGFLCTVMSGLTVLIHSDETWRSVGYLQIETEVPNIKAISTDESLDNDVATATITIDNQWMQLNDDDDPHAAGEPGFMGYFSFDRGMSPLAYSRWLHQTNEWTGVLTPNALLRTYQGYGGATGGIDDAVAAGYLVLSGTWLVDEVRITTDGTIELRCRSMAKLLIEQQLYPPLVPASLYPVRYCRWIWTPEVITTSHRVADMTGPGGLAYETSGNVLWYPDDGACHGHLPAEAFDGNPDTFWLSVGNDSPEEPFAAEYIQGDAGGVAIDAVTVAPYLGNYACYVSIMEGGEWVDEIGLPPYDQAGIGRYTMVPAVMKFGVPWEEECTVALPRVYAAQKVRFTFTNLVDTQWGPYSYRAAIREVGVSLGGAVSAGGSHVVSESHTEIIQSDGNYRDFSDIVKDLLLWAGWCLFSLTTNVAEVYGNIESTGSYSDDCFPDDAFDKKPVIDAITTVKEVVGYIFWVTETGSARFESPNWWSPGNFYEDGARTSLIPQIDEGVHLTSYAVQFSDEDARSQVIIASAEPTAALEGTLVTDIVPPTAALLKGMVRPAMWVNQVFTSPNEQRTMADLIALHIWFKMRQGQATCVANPAIGLNDQVRILERTSGETYIHYVRGKSTQWDKASGAYTMVLTTHWLGDADSWAVGV